MLGKLIISNLALHDIKPDWIVDRNAEIGSEYMNINILPLSNLKNAEGRFVMLASTHIRDMADACMANGATKWILPAAISDWCHINDFGICNDGERHIDELKTAYSLMADEKSRDVFRMFVRWHHTFDNNFSNLRDPVFYFPEDLQSLIDYSFFVDVGAFDGDTLRDWLRIFESDLTGREYHAFEPNLQSFEKLNAVVAALSDTKRVVVRTENIALGSENYLIEMINYGDMLF